MRAGCVCALISSPSFVANVAMLLPLALHNCEFISRFLWQRESNGHAGEQEGESRLRQPVVRPLPQAPHALRQLRLRKGTSQPAAMQPLYLKASFVSTTDPTPPRRSSACGLASVPSASRGTRTRTVPGSIGLLAFRLNRPPSPRPAAPPPHLRIVYFIASLLAPYTSHKDSVDAVSLLFILITCRRCGHLHIPNHAHSSTLYQHHDGLCYLSSSLQ